MNLQEYEKAREERERGHFLFQNYLERKDIDLGKAGEHFWGAINNLLSGINRIERGKGLGKHSEIRKASKELLEVAEGLEPSDFDYIEDLHTNFYHDHLEEERYQRCVIKAKKFYDFLDHRLSKMLSRFDVAKFDRDRSCK